MHVNHLHPAHFPITEGSLKSPSFIVFPCSHHIGLKGVEILAAKHRLSVDDKPTLQHLEKKIKCPCCQIPMDGIFEDREFQQVVEDIEIIARRKWGYWKLANGLPSEEKYNCPITFESMVVDAVIVKPCAHHFSGEGMSQWNAPECPQCRSQITDIYADEGYEVILQSLDSHTISYKNECIDLFLTVKLVDSVEHAETVFKALATQRVEGREWNALLETFRDRLGNLLSSAEEYSRLKKTSVQLLFDCFLNTLHCSKNQENACAIAFYLQQIFQCTSRYYCLAEKKEQLMLPLEVHERSLQVCVNLLQEEVKDRRITECLLKALPHMIDHNDFSADRQLELLPLLYSVTKVASTSIRFLHACTTLEHAKPSFRSVAANELFDYVGNRKNVNKNRICAIECLPFSPEYLNIDEKLLSDAATLLLNLTQDSSESVKMRKRAGKALSLWVSSHREKVQTGIIDSLVHLIKDIDVPQGVRNTVARWLFSRITAAEPSDRTLLHLLAAFKELINNEELPLSTRKMLAFNKPRELEDQRKRPANSERREERKRRKVNS